MLDSGPRVGWDPDPAWEGLGPGPGRDPGRGGPGPVRPGPIASNSNPIAIQRQSVGILIQTISEFGFRFIFI